MDIRDAINVDEAEKRIREASARALEAAVRELREAHAALGDVGEPLKALVSASPYLAVREFEVVQQGNRTAEDMGPPVLNFRANGWTTQVEDYGQKPLQFGRYRLIVAVVPIAGPNAPQTPKAIVVKL